MKYMIGKSVNGISLNGNEYLLDDNGDIMKFDNKDNCLNFIKENITDENPEDFLWNDEDEY